MRTESTVYANYELIIDDFEIPVAVKINGQVKYRLYDKVYVTDDGHGYICPGVEKPGFGKIVEIRRDDTDHFFGVRMDDGTFGFMKSARLEVVA